MYWSEKALNQFKLWCNPKLSSDFSMLSAYDYSGNSLMSSVLPVIYSSHTDAPCVIQRPLSPRIPISVIGSDQHLAPDHCPVQFICLPTVSHDLKEERMENQCLDTSVSPVCCFQKATEGRKNSACIFLSQYLLNRSQTLYVCTYQSCPPDGHFALLSRTLIGSS